MQKETEAQNGYQTIWPSTVEQSGTPINFLSMRYEEDRPNAKIQR